MIISMGKSLTYVVILTRGIHNIGKAIRNILTDLEGTPEISFSGITPKILTIENYVKNKKKLIGMF